MSSLKSSYLISQLPSSTPGAETHSFKDQLWMYGTFTLLATLTAVLVYGKLKLSQFYKNIQFEQYKSQDLKKKLKLALHTIKKMETNPDLVHSRAFNLDYLRMRMDEEVFHYVIINQIKIKIVQLIGEALRPNTAKNAVGIIPGSRQVEKTFDVTYEVEIQEGKWNKGVLFRIQIKLTKLPTQTSTATVNEIIKCIEIFLSATEEHDHWQPAIHGHVVLMSWDQKAKPTPLMVLEQSEEGANVSFRSTPLKVLSSIPSSRPK